MGWRLLLSLTCVCVLSAVACGKTRRTDQRDAAVVDAGDGGDDASAEDAGLADSGPDAGPEPTLECTEMHRRADETTQAMLFLHWSPNVLALSAQGRGDNPTNMSGFGHMMAVLADGVERTQGVRYYGWLDVLYDWQSSRGWTSVSYEQMADAAYGLLHAYEAVVDDRYLDTAAVLVTTLMSAWNTTCCGDKPGGLWATIGRTTKTTRVNATAIIAAVLLYEQKRDDDALAFARMAYDYWFDAMVDAETHQVHGGLDVDGDVDPGQFTGDQGLMIGASLVLYRATKEEQYLANAHALAEYLVTEQVDGNGVLSDGSVGACNGDCLLGKGMAFRWLSALQQEDPREAYADALSTSVESLYTYAWDYGGIDGPWEFGVDWSLPVDPGGDSDIRKNVAALTALNLAGRLLEDCPYPHSPNVYEAEDAAFVGLVPEYSHAGFSGWGLLGYFFEEGDAVTFTVDIPTEGYYVVTFRYAAATGTAGRTLLVDGNVFNANLAFTGTATWMAYRTLSVGVSRLEAGKHEITLKTLEANGNTSYVNVDNLTIEPAEE